MPGLKEDITNKQKSDINHFQNNIKESIQEFGIDHPELMDSITQLCTT